MRGCGAEHRFIRAARSHWTPWLLGLDREGEEAFWLAEYKRKGRNRKENKILSNNMMPKKGDGEVMRSGRDGGDGHSERTREWGLSRTRPMP